MVLIYNEAFISHLENDIARWPGDQGAAEREARGQHPRHQLGRRRGERVADDKPSHFLSYFSYAYLLTAV
jgi:hypothetical protein